ncbi:FecR family protein [Chitinophaga arvensicola]|uniref:FecR protein n=1 Tax=Chitinophaga arvensicola TaxID=29529 RepID=A0A1I0R603_9BACT|nr:FecR family protein [Chitinophaga arvensicola]SEW35466.1 FecR protein [Chitinophaga arvensicola]
MSTTEVQLLLEKYKNGQISQEELLRLQEMVTGNDYEPEIKADIMQTLHNTAPQSNWATGEGEEILQRILQSPGRRTHIRYLKQYAAAAAILGAALLAGGFYLSRVRHSAPVAMQKHPPLAPGGNKAMLVLADGSTIPLDSANTGNLAKQGDARITNSGQGLAYEAEGAGAAVVYNTVVTPRGGQYQLTLADGSKVWLNASSSIRFPTAFAEKERLVEISGEGYFQVAPNAQQPFRVKVKGQSDMEVKVLGTSFNIMAYADEQTITTTLESGAVQLVHGNVKSLLQPGFDGSLAPGNDNFQIGEADMEQALAWKEGKFRFRNTSIQTIMRQMARWYNIEVSYEGDLSDIRLTGIISRRENAAALLKILSSTKRVHFDINDNRILVKPTDPQ